MNSPTSAHQHPQQRYSGDVKSSTIPTSVPGVLIRTAQEADYPAIAELTYAAYVEAGHVDADDPYVHQLIDIKSRAASAGRLITAEVDGAIAGSTLFVTGGMDLAETAQPGEFEFRMLGVHPRFRRRGVGRAMVLAAIRRAGELGCHAIALTTMDSMVDAQHMYLNMGFQPAPDRDWKLSDRGWAEPEEGEETFRVFTFNLTSD